MHLQHYLDWLPTHDADWRIEATVKGPIAGEASQCRDDGR